MAGLFLFSTGVCIHMVHTFCIHMRRARMHFCCRKNAYDFSLAKSLSECEFVSDFDESEFVSDFDESGLPGISNPNLLLKEDCDENSLYMSCRSSWFFMRTLFQVSPPANFQCF